MQTKPYNSGVHFGITVVTLGLWAPVWIMSMAKNAAYYRRVRQTEAQLMQVLSRR